MSVEMLLPLAIVVVVVLNILEVASTTNFPVYNYESSANESETTTKPAVVLVTSAAPSPSTTSHYRSIFVVKNEILPVRYSPTSSASLPEDVYEPMSSEIDTSSSNSYLMPTADGNKTATSYESAIHRYIDQIYSQPAYSETRGVVDYDTVRNSYPRDSEANSVPSNQDSWTGSDGGGGGKTEAQTQRPLSDDDGGEQNLLKTIAPGLYQEYMATMVRNDAEEKEPTKEASKEYLEDYPHHAYHHHKDNHHHDRHYDRHHANHHHHHHSHHPHDHHHHHHTIPAAIHTKHHLETYHDKSKSHRHGRHHHHHHQHKSPTIDINSGSCS